MKTRRSYVPQIILCILLLGITGLSAKDLVTKKGRVFKNYKILRQEGSFVIVDHDAGGARVRISDLPDNVARPYVKSLVKMKIEEARKEKDLDKRERKLKKLKTQYPALQNMIEDEITLVREEKDLENEIAKAVSAGTEPERIKNLQRLLEIYSEEPREKERLEREIAERSRQVHAARVRDQEKERLEREIAERPGKRKEIFDDIIRSNEKFEPDAIARMEKAVKEYEGTPEAEKGKALLAGWKIKKQSQVRVYHPEAVSKCHVYIFKCSDHVERALKEMVELHWTLNKTFDVHERSLNAGQVAQAERLLKTWGEGRKGADQLFQALLNRESGLVSGTDYTGKGMCLNGVNGEYIFFILEVTERGKYIHSWCHRARGGDDLYIKGRNIRSSR